MKTFLKQVVGIDVAKNELVVSLGRIDENLDVEIFAYKTFANRTSGFTALKKWAGRLLNPQTAVLYVMEATGVYHESLAYWLEENGSDVSIVLPNKISNFFKTLDVNTITDKTASEAIARFGLERKLMLWKKPKKIYLELKQLTRERNQLVDERTVLKNQLHAEKAQAFPNPDSIGRLKKRVQLINQQECEIRSEIDSKVRNDKEVAEKTKNISSIPGVGNLTAITVLAETNGFDLIRNKKQLVSYCGLDVKNKDSGTSVKGKPKISKKGNKHIRKAMHLPALSAIKHNEQYKNLFARLVSKHGIKMKAVVAAQRKLLELIYVIAKNDCVFVKEYGRIKNQELEVVEI